MDAMQFSLFFVALLVGYVLVHLRLLRFEEHLQKLAGIRGLDDRLRTIDDRLRVLADGLDPARLQRVDAGLQRLHEDLEDLREATAGVQHAIVQIPVPSVPAGDAAPAAAAAFEAPWQRVVTLVENRLLQLGYHDVQVLTDLGDARPEREVEVQVECARGGMPVKGRVVVVNGSVRDVALQTVAPMFP